VDLDGTRAA